MTVAITLDTKLDFLSLALYLHLSVAAANSMFKLSLLSLPILTMTLVWILLNYDGPDPSAPSSSFTMVYCVSALASVLGLRAHLRKKLYVMITNLCSMYMKTISQMY